MQGQQRVHGGVFQHGPFHIPPEVERSGHLGVMDYYRMQNIQADTDMRGAIAQPEGGKK